MLPFSNNIRTIDPVTVPNDKLSFKALRKMNRLQYVIGVDTMRTLPTCDFPLHFDAYLVVSSSSSVDALEHETRRNREITYYYVTEAISKEQSIQSRKKHTFERTKYK